MQRLSSLVFFLVGFALQVFSAKAGLSFGSKESAINLVGGKFSTTNAIQGWDGTLTTSSERNLTSGQINFNSGRLLVNNVPAIISGRLQGAVAQQLQLLGSQAMRIEAGHLPARLYVSGTGNRFEGQPIFSDDTSSNPNITIGADASLRLALQSVCNGFINLSNSSLILDDDLIFAEGKEITGIGIINGNCKKISFSGSNLILTGTLIHFGPMAVVFNSNSHLTSNWTIASADLSKQIYISGNGNTLDFSLGGTLSISPGVKVALSNIKIKGLGGSNGGFSFGSPTSQLRLSDVQLELDNNYTVTMGNIYVDGPTTIVTKNKTLTFSSRGTLSVDGVTLWYDTAGYDDDQNIKPGRSFTTNASSANFGIKNGGAINHLKADGEGTLSVNSSGLALRVDLNLTSTKKIIATDNAFIDGRGRVIIFSTDDNVITLPARKRLTFSNITLQGFSPQHIPSGDGRSVMFGDDVIIKLGQTKSDIARGSIILDGRWFFGGTKNIVLDGCGNTLDISSNISAMALISTGTLTIQNMKIFGLDNIAGLSNLRILNRHGTINFKNVELIHTGDFEFTRGYLNIYQDVLLSGVDRRFIYRSQFPLTITDSAILSLDYGMTFSYDSLDQGGLKNQHLKFATDSSTLHLDGSILHATKVGLQIPRGTIFATNAVTLSSEGSTIDNGLIVASRVNVHVLAAATLSLDGKVVLE